jgi:hypothetical protein
MSAFRAITAEEEAATALILALKHRRYPGADRLDHRRHEQKVAITPFLQAVAKAFSDPEVPPPQIHISTKEPRVEISMDISTFTDAPKPFYVSPDEPLNFAVQSDKQGGRMQAHRFERDFHAIAEGRGAADILAYVRSEANMRNQLLYANEEGIPHISFGDGFLIERARRVCRLFVLTIAVLQTPKHQLFVVQCLEAFLAALRKLDAPFFSFADAMPKRTGPMLQIEQQPDGSYRTGVVQRIVGDADIRYQFLPVWRVRY